MMSQDIMLLMGFPLSLLSTYVSFPAQGTNDKSVGLGNRDYTTIFYNIVAAVI